MATKDQKVEAKVHDINQIKDEKKEAPKQESQNKIPYFSLFRYATNYDKTLMMIGAIAAFLNGGAMPSFSLIFGNMIDSFQEAGDEMVTQAGWNAIWFVVVAIGTAILSFTMFATWMISGERQGIEFRKNYFKAILHQEVGWFDTINPNELNNKVANEAFAVQGAIGEKVPTFIMTFSLTFFGFLYGFIWGWQLAIVITATLPALTIITAVFSSVIQSSVMATGAAYSEAGALAEQAINSIKTVKMLDGEDYEHQKYFHLLEDAAQRSMKYDLGVGMAIGLLWASSLWSYALGFWYGAKLIADQTYNHNQDTVYTVGDVMTIFFSVVTGGFSLGQAGPCIQNFAKGQAAAASMYEVLDRIPKIKMPSNPKKLQNFNGEINLKNITFSYPNRPDQIVLNGLTLQIPAGKKVALVGESGCGKSTVMQLVERFYDCDQGEIIFGGIDGYNVKDLDLVDLRSRIGLVGQEPVLFATSIKENLLYGKTDATEEEMIDALKKANAWDFVSKMDKGLETYVGIGGGQLSGGQKQRIAIARAIIKKPQVLLLDEATSALDRTNERLIQQTLDEVSKGITTLVIAHRLTTVQNADLIYVIEKGIVVEQGTHQELINKHGKYEALAKTQISNQDEEIVSETQKLKGKKIVLESLNNPNKVEQNNNETIKNDKRINMNILENKSIADEAADQFKQISELDLLIKDKNQSTNQKVYQQVDDNSKNETKPEVDAQMGRLFNYNKKERIPFLIGIVVSLANGCTFPLFSLFLSDIITVLALSNPKLYAGSERASKMAYVRSEADKNALYFFIIGCAAFILWAIQSFCMSYVGERLTLKLRSDTFRKLLRMPISFFDEPKNNAGTLTSRLSVDCKLINGLTSSIIGINLANFASLVCGLVIAFTSSWALTLVTLGITPLTFISGILQAKFLQGFSALTDEAYKDSGNLIMEAVTNIRTVFSFGNEKIILEIYSEKVRQPLELAKQKGIKAGLAMGFSQMNIFLINAIIFYVGAVFCRDIDLSVNDMFRTIFSLMFATMGAGNNAAFAGDIGAAKNASKNIFEILDAEDEFQREIRLNRKKLTQPIQGDIIFNNLSFKYNSRDKNVFENLSLTVKQGQKVAFVGPSGCGKSTLMQMLMRFYEPDQGTITVNGIDITDYDIKYLRRQFGIVSQEPVLFNGTIKENIQYNLDEITTEQIEQAAKQANAYDFIIKNQFEETQIEMKGNQKQLGQGFERQVGPKGAQISGGQKQRIAIARAILRDCNLLLLDEATSALDAASEQLVQESLNALMVNNKTTIAIAHRISTIKDSDLIYVFEDGKIVEEGNYQSLVNLKGSFYRLEQGISK